MDETSQSAEPQPGADTDPSPNPSSNQSDSEAKTNYGSIDLSEPREGEPQGLRDLVLDQIRTVFDPEIPVNIYELGLIYDITIDGQGGVAVVMTLTSPMCPVAESLPVEVESRIKDIDGVSAAKVGISWEPTWTMEHMSEVAKLELGM